MQYSHMINISRMLHLLATEPYSNTEPKIIAAYLLPSKFV